MQMNVAGAAFPPHTHWSGWPPDQQAFSVTPPTVPPAPWGLGVVLTCILRCGLHNRGLGEDR